MRATGVPRLRIAFFGSASRFSQLALEQLAPTQEIVALVLPRTSRRGLRHALRNIARLRVASPLERIARACGIPILTAPDVLTGAFCERLRSFQPDLICIAIFPRILPKDLMAVAPLGAVNAHPSLLPRHRGPLPLFWTYHCDDRSTGVTVHHANERFDAGDIILQERFDLPRGYPVAELDRDVAARTAPLLRAAVEQLALGSAPRIPQDERAATFAPLVRPGMSMISFGEWDVERIWHFLVALVPQYREPLVDETAREVLYDRVIGYRRTPTDRGPGCVESSDRGWLLHCRNGIVQLGRNP